MTRELWRRTSIWRTEMRKTTRLGCRLFLKCSDKYSDKWNCNFHLHHICAGLYVIAKVWHQGKDVLNYPNKGKHIFEDNSISKKQKKSRKLQQKY